MSPSHLDSLAAAGFNRAIVKFIGDSLGARGAPQLIGWLDRGKSVAVEVVPSWALQSRKRLAALPTARRYTSASGAAESGVGCPLDSAFWRSTFLDRAGELLDAAPGIARLAVDLEIYTGTSHHYHDVCICDGCLAEFARATHETSPGRDRLPATASEARALLGDRASGFLAALQAFEEARATALLGSLVSEFARARPGVELGVFDLDLDSFVHRAMGRALARAKVATVDYSERTYATGGAGARDARSALQSLGVTAPLVAGVWLKKWTPGQLPSAVRSLLDQSDGYFVFTTFSLWAAPSERTGAYALLGTPQQYWTALREANR
jgi:hypothetical protein